MTIRGRLHLILSLVTAIVVALSVLLIVTATRTQELASEPQKQLSDVRRVHAFGDATARVAKDMMDLATGEEDGDELAEALDDARDAFETLLAGAGDAETRALATELEVDFRALERGALALIQHVEGGNPAEGADDAEDAEGEEEGAEGEEEGDEEGEEAAGPAAAARELAEELYEGDFRQKLAALDYHQTEIAAGIYAEASHDARLVVIATAALVAAGMAAVVVAIFVVLGIRRRVTKLSAAVTSLAADSTSRASDESGDELGQLAQTFNRMADDLDQLIETRAQKEALATELALAARLQQSLVPRKPRVTGLEIAGAMSTAAEVGGDYYDVIPTPDGAWIGIGDVSGHGFNAGVVMLMAQSAISASIRANPDAKPSEILRIVNQVLHDNVRERLDRSEHMTLTLLRYHDDGRVELAGAHQEIILRGTDGTVRTVETPGPWVAVVPDVVVEDGRLDLARGETMVLFTDGVVEARTDADAMYGIERLVDSVVESPAAAHAVCDAVFAQLASAAPTLDDDATVLVVRRIADDHQAAA